MRRAGWVRMGFWLAFAALGAGCPAPHTEPPPPPAKPEIAPAPPRALGARAAGTDAAPRPESFGASAPLLPSPASPVVPDAGDAAPEGEDAGAKPAPDSGMAL